MVAPLIGAAIGAAGRITGGIISGNQASDAANKAWDRQKAVLQRQVTWRVRDAVRAGIHPLAALGLNPASGPPMASIGTDWASNLGEAGQDLGRAAEAALTPEDQTTAQLTRLAVERGTLENELLRTQIASQRMRNMQQATPGVPRPGRPTGLVHPDGSMVAGDNGMGSKAFLLSSDPATGFKTGMPGAAQQIADNYGDLAQELYGLYRFGADAYNSLEGDGLIGQAGSDIIKSYIPKYLMDPGNPGEVLEFVW